MPPPNRALVGAFTRSTNQTYGTLNSYYSNLCIDAGIVRFRAADDTTDRDGAFESDLGISKCRRQISKNKHAASSIEGKGTDILDSKQTLQD
jgi:hypothetical protein